MHAAALRVAIAFSLALSMLVTVSDPAEAYGILPHDITRISLSTNGFQGFGISDSPALSTDGTKVAFRSASSNLVSLDSNNKNDIFLHDTLAGTTIRVSLATDGSQGLEHSYAPSISGDGNWIAFDTKSSLVPDDTNDQQDVYVHHVPTGTTTRVSVHSNGSQGSSASRSAAISGDGSKVAFISFSTELVDGDTNNERDVFLHDIATGVTKRVSVSSAEVESNGLSEDASVNWDGSKIAFQSWGSNLVPGDTNEVSDVFVRDDDSGTTLRVSRPVGAAEPNGISFNPSINEDGTRVSFTSGASNLVAGDTNGWKDIFVRDTAAQTTTRISVSTNGAQGDLDSDGSRIDGAGNRIAFWSRAATFVGNDQNDVIDVFVHDLTNGRTVRVSVGYNRRESDRPASSAFDISGDGSIVGFSTHASNFVLGDTNGTSDVFLTPADCCNDRDGDGLDDDEEIHLGTKIWRADTDQDGVGDRTEVVTNRTDPTEPPAQVALFDATSGEWHLRSGNGSTTSFFYGNPGDVPMMGDWDCDGIDTVGMFRPSNGFAYLRNTNDFGPGEISFFFGNAGDTPLVGDWDGDGCDSLGVYRNGRVFLRNTLDTGVADVDFWFGFSGDAPFAGDFDNDGISEIGLFRQTSGFAYLRNDHTTGMADHDFFFGEPGDVVISGDWNNDYTDTVGIWRPADATFYLADTNDTVAADYTIPFGTSTWIPAAGDFN